MIPPTITAILTIHMCQLVGEGVSQASRLPIPGPVMGMALMLAGLITSAPLRAVIRPVAGTILGNLMLLFVPAGVGAMMQIGSLGHNAGPILLAITVSTLAAISVAALTFALVSRLTGDRAEGDRA